MERAIYTDHIRALTTELQTWRPAPGRKQLGEWFCTNECCPVHEVRIVWLRGAEGGPMPFEMPSSEKHGPFCPGCVMPLRFLSYLKSQVIQQPNA